MVAVDEDEVWFGPRRASLANLRLLAIELARERMLTRALRAHGTGDLAMNAGIDIGLWPDAGADGPAKRIGQIMKRCFAVLCPHVSQDEPATAEFESYFIRREIRKVARPHKGKYSVKVYCFSRERLDAIPGAADMFAAHILERDDDLPTLEGD